MSGTSNINIVVGQGTAIKEIHNVKKQNLEMNQQFIAQKTVDDTKEDKSKVQEFEQKDKVEIQKDKDKKDKDKKRQKDNPEGSNIEKSESEDELDFSEGNLIDITV